MFFGLESRETTSPSYPDFVTSSIVNVILVFIINFVKGYSFSLSWIYITLPRDTIKSIYSIKYVCVARVYSKNT